MNNADFANQIDLLAQQSGTTGFRTYAVYEPHGDTVEFVTKSDPYYAERIDDRLTVYISESTGDVIGGLIKSAKRLCDRLQESFPGFRIEIHDGRVRLAAIVRAAVWSSDIPDDKLPTIRYQKMLVEQAEFADDTIELIAC